MSFLSLLRGGNFTSSNSPDWLISDNNITPLSFGHFINDGLELSGINFTCLSRFSLFELFSNAEHNVETILDGNFSLKCNIFVGFSEKWSSFGVTSQGPFDIEICKLIGSDISSVSSSSILRDILSTYLNIRSFQILLNRGHMKIGWSNNNFNFWFIEFSFSENLFWEGINEFHISVGFPVSSDDVVSINITPWSFSTFWKSRKDTSGSAKLFLGLSSGYSSTHVEVIIFHVHLYRLSRLTNWELVLGSTHLGVGSSRGQVLGSLSSFIGVFKSQNILGNRWLLETCCLTPLRSINWASESLWRNSHRNRLIIHAHVYLSFGLCAERLSRHFDSIGLTGWSHWHLNLIFELHRRLWSIKSHFSGALSHSLLTEVLFALVNDISWFDNWCGSEKGLHVLG